jgi:hypothetical protein
LGPFLCACDPLFLILTCTPLLDIIANNHIDQKVMELPSS